MVTINGEQREAFEHYGYAIHGIIPTPPWVERRQPTWWQRVRRLPAYLLLLLAMLTLEIALRGHQWWTGRKAGRAAVSRR